MRVATHLARTERSLIEDVQLAQSDIRIRRGRLAEQMSEINLTRSEAEDRRIELEALQGIKGQALAEVRAERARFDASLKEMEGAAAQMEDLLARLQSGRSDDAQTTTGFGQMAGRLQWPVRGQILKPFGRSVHPEFGTVVMNKGINIGAPMGTPILCVAAGRVEYVDWLPGYGRCIIVDHGDGYYTLYAHASEIFPVRGAAVHAGEVLGEVGDTGSLNGSQLYFEIRKGKDSLDPRTWLSRQRG
jgi:septal ring factor EnvC (AmiA/AmiB activator)